MVSISKIKQAVKETAEVYPVKKVTLFGSYAKGLQTEASDVDLLVEFSTDVVSLLTLGGMKLKMEDLLGKEVDIVHGPLSKDAMITIDKEIPIYEAPGLRHRRKITV